MTFKAAKKPSNQSLKTNQRKERLVFIEMKIYYTFLPLQCPCYSFNSLAKYKILPEPCVYLIRAEYLKPGALDFLVAVSIQ